MFSERQGMIRDLGNGLHMRHATREDADALCEFNAKILGEEEADRKGVVAWTRDLLTRPHATFQPGDFIIVEESLTGWIVSSMCLIPQTWSYEGIEFGVARPELVGTLPEFRGRGLIQAQFDEVHRWSAERSLLVQAGTGIRTYFRKLGYEYALDLNRGVWVRRCRNLKMANRKNMRSVPLRRAIFRFSCLRMNTEAAVD